MNSTITIKTNAGDFAAYVAYPDADKAPAVVVLHEVFGVNEDIRLTCQALAAQGFIAIAPDLFWRQEPGVDLSVTSEADWKKGLGSTWPTTATPVSPISRPPLPQRGSYPGPPARSP